MQVPMMQMGPGGQQQSPILPQPGGIIRGQAQPGGIIRGQAQPGGMIRGQAQPSGIIRGQMIHMTPSQQLRPVSSAVSLTQIV